MLSLLLFHLLHRKIVLGVAIGLKILAATLKDEVFGSFKDSTLNAHAVLLPRF